MTKPAPTAKKQAQAQANGAPASAGASAAGGPSPPSSSAPPPGGTSALLLADAAWLAQLINPPDIPDECPRCQGLFCRLYSNPAWAATNKNPLMLLNEYAMKRTLVVHMEDSLLGSHGPYQCKTTLSNAAREPLAMGTGVGQNKKLSKQNAASSLIEALLTAGGVPEDAFLAPVLPGMLNRYALATAGAAAAAAAANNVVQPISGSCRSNVMLVLDQYPACKALMTLLSQQGAAAGAGGGSGPYGQLLEKTPLMVLNEFSTRHSLKLAYGELAHDPSGMFRSDVSIRGALTGGEAVAAAAGSAGPGVGAAAPAGAGAAIELSASGLGSNKQNAKQTAAAALLEAMLAGPVPQEAFLRWAVGGRVTRVGSEGLG